MIKRNDKKDETVTPLFETLAVLEQNAKTPEAKVSLPSRAAVKQAKDWVDENEL